MQQRVVLHVIPNIWWDWLCSVRGVAFCFTGISNCEFHSGKAEAVLPQLLSSWEDARPIVAVVNPSRSGLRKWICYLFSSWKQRILNKFCETGSKPSAHLVSSFLPCCWQQLKSHSLLFSVPLSCFLFKAGSSNLFSIFHTLTELFRREGASGGLWCSLPPKARRPSELYKVAQGYKAQLRFECAEGWIPSPENVFPNNI